MAQISGYTDMGEHQRGALLGTLRRVPLWCKYSITRFDHYNYGGQTIQLNKISVEFRPTEQ